MKKYLPYVYFTLGLLGTGYLIIPMSIVHEACHALVGIVFHGGVYDFGWAHTSIYGDSFLFRVSGYIGETIVWLTAYLVLRKHNAQFRHFFSGAVLGVWVFVSFFSDWGPGTDMVTRTHSWVIWIAVSVMSVAVMSIMVRDAIKKARLHHPAKTGILKTGYGRVDV